MPILAADDGAHNANPDSSMACNIDSDLILHARNTFSITTHLTHSSISHVGPTIHSRGNCSLNVSSISSKLCYRPWLALSSGQIDSINFHWLLLLRLALPGRHMPIMLAAH